MVEAVPPVVPRYPAVGVAAGQEVEPPLPVAPPVPPSVEPPVLVEPPSPEALPPVPLESPEVNVQARPHTPRIATNAIPFQRSIVFIAKLLPVPCGLDVREDG